MLLLLVSLAHAHIPHDNTRSAAGATGGGAWWLLGDPQGIRVLLRSTDRGTTFASVGGPSIADNPDKVTALDDGTGVVLGTTRYWWSADGTTWDDEALPGANTIVLGGDELLLGGLDGVWEGTPGAMSLTLDTQAVIGGPGPTLVDLRRRVWWKDAGAWTSTGLPADADPSAVAGDGTDLYVGGHDGLVWHYDGARWTECGALPADPTAHTTYPDIVNLALSGTDLLAATGWRAPFVSTDGCATWEDRGTPIDVTYDGDGSAGDVSVAYPIFFVNDDRWAVGGWVGFYWTGDEGASWAEAPTVPADYTRGIAFADDFDTTRRVHLGTYAAGTGWTEDGGASFTFAAHGLTNPNVQQLDTSGDPALLFGVIGHTAWLSPDAGSSWAQLVTGMTTAGDVFPFHGGTEIWVFEEASAGQQLAGSADGGSSWAPLADLLTALHGKQAAGAVGFQTADGTEARCVSTQSTGGLLCSLDGGTTWAGAALTGDGARATSPVAWPPSAPTRVVWTDAQGVHVSEDLGANITTLTPFGLDLPLELTEADDGTLVVVTWGGEVWRSDDGGATWVDLAVAVPSWTHVVATRPDFAHHPDVLIGTHDGNFHVADTTGATPTIARWAQWERIDQGTEYFICATCRTSIDDEMAGMGTLLQLDPGSVSAGLLRGSEFRVIGRETDAGGGDIYADGVLVGSFGGKGSGVLADVTVGDAGWHQIELHATGDGLLLDAVEMITPGDVLAFDADDTGNSDSGDTAVDSGDTSGDTSADTSDDSGNDTSVGDTGGGDTSDGDTSGGHTSGEASDKGGCGCATGGDERTGTLVAGLALTFLGTRRRRVTAARRPDAPQTGYPARPEEPCATG